MTQATKSCNALAQHTKDVAIPYKLVSILRGNVNKRQRKRAIEKLGHDTRFHFHLMMKKLRTIYAGSKLSQLFRSHTQSFALMSVTPIERALKNLESTKTKE